MIGPRTTTVIQRGRHDVQSCEFVALGSAPGNPARPQAVPQVRDARPGANSVIYDISKESKARAANGADWGCRVSLVFNRRPYECADPIAMH